MEVVHTSRVSTTEGHTSRISHPDTWRAHFDQELWERAIMEMIGLHQFSIRTSSLPLCLIITVCCKSLMHHICELHPYGEHVRVRIQVEVNLIHDYTQSKRSMHRAADHKELYGLQ